MQEVDRANGHRPSFPSSPSIAQNLCSARTEMASHPYEPQPYSSYTHPPVDQFARVPLQASPELGRQDNNPPYPSEQPYRRESGYSYGGGDYTSRTSGYGPGDFAPSPTTGRAVGEDGRRVKSSGAFKRFFAAYNTKNQLAFLGLIILQSAAVLSMIGLIYGTINDVSLLGARCVTSKLTIHHS